jgi:hypothetical protein
MRPSFLVALGLCACSSPHPAKEALPLSAAETCHPAAERCATSASPAGLFAGYRKDFFFPYAQYPEASILDPTDGGRVQIATIAKTSGAVQKVLLGGTDMETLYGEGGLDWYHVWPRQAVAGQPIWLAFHTRSARYEAGPTTLQITTDAGTAADGSFELRTSRVELVSISPTVALDTLLIHVRNGDTAPRTLTHLHVNGEDVTPSACLPISTLAPGETTLLSVPLCHPLVAGQAWTVVLEVQDAPAVVATGRAFAPFFPIETWPSSSDCPFPGEGNGTFEEHVAHGIDTFFVHDGYSCPVSSGDQILQSIAATPGVFTLPERDLHLPTGTPAHVAARFCGDESDNELSHALDTQHCSDQFWAENPEIPTYVGGSRSRHNGAFAGSTDIQGMDFYVCNCAPHITDFGTFPPFRGAYDYTVANRRNHAPLPTWTYTQGFSGAWDVTANTPGAIPNYRQVTPAEMRAEALSVIAGGAKGLMYFQTKLEQAHQFPESWAELSRVNHDLIPVRDILSVGGATGLASADAQTIVEAIRGPDAIVVPAVSLAFANDFAAPDVTETNDVLCGIGMNLHWQWAPHTTDIRVDVPADLAVSEVFEIRNGQTLAVTADLKGRALTLRNVAFGEDAPARLFVLAASAEEASRIRSLLRR